jgi:hypothetical protein
VSGHFLDHIVMLRAILCNLVSPLLWLASVPSWVSRTSLTKEVWNGVWTGIPDPRRMRTLEMAWKGWYRPGPHKYITAFCDLSCRLKFCICSSLPWCGTVQMGTLSHPVLFFSVLALVQSPVRTPQHLSSRSPQPSVGGTFWLPPLSLCPWWLHRIS